MRRAGRASGVGDRRPPVAGSARRSVRRRAPRGAPTGTVAAGVAAVRRGRASCSIGRIASVRRTAPRRDARLVGGARGASPRVHAAAPRRADAFTAAPAAPRSRRPQRLRRRRRDAPPDGWAPAGDLRKVVLARTIEVDAGRALDPGALAHRLRAVDPDAYTFAAPPSDGIARRRVARAARVAARPTSPLEPARRLGAARRAIPSEDRANADALLARRRTGRSTRSSSTRSPRRSAPRCDELRWDPRARAAGDAERLAPVDPVRGDARDAGSDARSSSRSRCTRRPAIGGWPARARAGGDRRRSSRSTAAATRDRSVGSTLRATASSRSPCGARSCAGERATLYAGAGIVAASDPDAELDETERKFGAFLDALRWG